jgi:hypothetical protein
MHRVSASGTPLRSTARTRQHVLDRETRKNFEAMRRVVSGSLKSMLLIHLPPEEAGGDFFHSGGKHWNSQDDAEWQT